LALDAGHITLIK